jgi:hypothetical protein
MPWRARNDIRPGSRLLVHDLLMGRATPPFHREEEAHFSSFLVA